MYKSLNSILEKAGVQVKKTSALQKEKNYFTNTIHCLGELYAYRYQNTGAQFNKEITGIVFSKNRAMQLHALLSSYFYYTGSPVPLKVLYTTDSLDHAESYKILMREFASQTVEFIKEDNFKMQARALIKDSLADRIFFMTDDAIFTSHFNLSVVLDHNPLTEIFSLRLGKDVHFCFAYNCEQDLPVFTKEFSAGEPVYRWNWASVPGSPDWCYPLSVDATVFCREEINIILKHIEFKNPNGLEANLQLFNNIFLIRKGLCFEKAKYVNVPCNIVQKEFNNIYTGTYNVSELVNLFLIGRRINWQMYQDTPPENVQQSKFLFI